ncbi:MAG TPA: ATP-binding protein, partial [Xanthobacteraceae bacterium]|nr:ATP-binding protein [Xanthobacteraceae bacterium]
GGGRGFGLGFGRALTCACSRIVLADGRAAILMAATEPAGPALPLAERVRRLFAGGQLALAAFTTDGTLLHASETARARLGGAASLSALGITATAAKAIETGSASATVRSGEVNMDAALQRLGDDASRVLVMTLAPQPSEAPGALKAAEPIVPADHPATTEIAALAPGTQAATLAVPPPAPPPQAAAPSDKPGQERRHPLRFVWQMDGDGRFVVGSDEFVDLVGPRTMAAFGRRWSEVAADLKLDPDGQLARAVATHETWSGIIVSWPVDETDERLPVELSGLPVFDRDRSFRGYRGFGVCRDVARINQLARVRRERPLGFMATPEPEVDIAPAPAQEAPAATPDSVTPGAPAAVEAAQRTERPVLSIAATAANVVPFRPGPAAEPKAPTLSPVERKAFRELAQELTARLRGTQDAPAIADNAVDGSLAEQRHGASEQVEPVAKTPAADLLPHVEAPARHDEAETHRDREDAQQPPALIEPALLDRIPIGILVYRHDALLYANRHFLEWTGYGSLDGLAAAGGLDSLFVEHDATGTLAETDGARSLSIKTRQGDTLPLDGRMFSVPWNGASALAMVLTNGAGAERRHAAELALAAAETELRNAKRDTQKAAAAKADFLAKVSHEIRTPLNAITGFAEVIMAERFGPIGNERYREYLKDIHGAGTHLVSLLNDLLDLSKIETGHLDLTFANVGLNELTQQCVGIMQPQANRARIIIRTALTPGLPQVVADERSLRQIVLNLLGNSIRFTGPGGQVIVSTAVSDSRDVMLRVRDTGVGMSEKDIEMALEPFRQTATSGSWGSGGTGLGLPLTKALAEANRANFSIKSAPNAGTLVEVAFPPSRVAAN